MKLHNVLQQLLHYYSLDVHYYIDSIYIAIICSHAYLFISIRFSVFDFNLVYHWLELHILVSLAFVCSPYLYPLLYGYI